MFDWRRRARWMRDFQTRMKMLNLEWKNESSWNFGIQILQKYELDFLLAFKPLVFCSLSLKSPDPCAFVFLQLRELFLDDCYSTSIAGLTEEFLNLKTLSFINVGLTTLKNFPNLPNLRQVGLISWVALDARFGHFIHLVFFFPSWNLARTKFHQAFKTYLAAQSFRIWVWAAIG